MTGNIYDRLEKIFTAVALILLITVGPAAAQNFFDEGVLNGRDDFEFAQSLAHSGYFELADKVADQICAHESDPARQKEGKRLRCSLLQIRAQMETDLEEKEILYQKATDSYQKLVKEAKTDEERWDLEREVGDLFIFQGEDLVYQAENVEEAEAKRYYEIALPLFEKGHEKFLDLKKETDDAGSDMDVRDENDADDQKRARRAEVRYHAWYGVCRALYFQGICGRKAALDECVKEVEKYLWEYQGRMGAFYAMTLHGMVLYEKKEFAKSLISFDGVLDPLQMYATVYLSTDKDIAKIAAEEETEMDSVGEFLSSREKWCQTLVGRYLFSMSGAYRDILDQGNLDDSIKYVFKSNGEILSDKPSLKVVKKGQEWAISDKDNSYFIVRDKDRLSVATEFSAPMSLEEISKTLKDCYKVDLVAMPDLFEKFEAKQLEYMYQGKGRMTLAAVLAKIVKDLRAKDIEADLCVLTYPKTKMLCLQATYHKIRALVRWNKFHQAIDIATSYGQYHENKFGVPLEEEELGQAILLETGKAYLGQGKYSEAVATAKSVAAQNTYWGFVGKKLLEKWVQHHPEAMNAESLYLVAIGQWRRDQYVEAALSFMKVIEYAKSREEVESYALDASEKLAQCFWFHELYLESAYCYELCARKLLEDPIYKGARKIVKGPKGEEKIDIGAKMAYWAYSGYRQSFRVSKDPEDKRQSEEIRDNLLLANPDWKKSPYASNPGFYKAQDKEQESQDPLAKAEKARSEAQKAAARAEKARTQVEKAEGDERARLQKEVEECQAREKECNQELAKHLADAIAIYGAAAPLYEEVDTRADLYESSMVSAGRCYYKAAELKVSMPGVDEKKPESWPNDIKADYEKARKQLDRYYDKYLKDYEKNKENFELEAAERRKNALAEALFYLGQIYFRQGKVKEAQDQWTTLFKDYKEQKEMASAAIYLLTKYEIDSGRLGKAENHLKDMEQSLGKEEGAVSTSAKEYRSYCYFLVGQKYLEQAETAEAEEEISDKIIEDYRKACQYLYKWRLCKTDISYKNADWLGSKFMHLGKLLLQFNQTTAAEKWYESALEVFQECYTLAESDKKRGDIEQKLVRCALEIQNWEKAAGKLYGIYRRDVRSRKEQNARWQQTKQGEEVPAKNPFYVQYLMRTLSGLALGESIEDSEKLYALLMSHAHQDFMDELAEFPKGANPETMFEKYRSLKEMASWVHQEQFGQAQKDALHSEFEQMKKAGKDVGTEYYEKCQELIASEFPENPNDAAVAAIPHGKRVEQIKRLCIELSYQFSSELVSKLPRNTPRRIEFDIDKKYENDLDAGKITEELLKEFQDNGEKLDKGATLEKKGEKWVISETKKGKTRYYYIRKTKKDLEVRRDKQMSLLYYDNSDWWEAKYCQLEMVYLRGDAGKADNFIEALKMQQPRLGGSEYEKKFRKLQERARQASKK